MKFEKASINVVKLNVNDFVVTSNEPSCPGALDNPEATE